MAVTSQMRTQVAQLYVSLFGRAPEASGLGYWAQQLGNGVSLQQIAQDMFNVAPSRAYYPSFLTNEEIITKFYVNVLGRNPDAGGLAYWTGRLNTLSSTGTAAQKALAQGSVITEMLTAVVGYNGTDAAGLQSQSLFNNKVAVALKYAVDMNGDSIPDASTLIPLVTAGPNGQDAANAQITKIFNKAPAFAAASVAASALEDAAVTGKVTATDSDAGDVLTYKLGTGPANGKVTVAADGSYSYVGNQDFNGADSFTVVVTDKSGATATQTVNVAVAAVNDAPAFAGATAAISATEDTPINGKVTATDVDAGDALTYKLGTAAANGKVTVAADGTYTYVGNQDFNGADSFTVIVTDKAGATATQTVNVSVAAVNDAPVFGAASITVAAQEDLVFSGKLAATDVDVTLNGDALTYSLGSQASKGVVTVGADGSYTYKGNQDFNGSDSFTVVVRDKAGAASTQTVFVNVAAVNDAPVFATAAVAAAGNEDTAITGTIVATDVDVATNADALTYSLGTAPANGTVTVDADGFFSYKGNQDFNGSDSFTVKVTDKSGAVSSQTVNVTVAAVNDAPVVTSGATATIAENAATSTVLYTATSSDVDAGDTVAYSLKASGDAAMLNIDAATGVVTLKASANFEAKSSYSFTVVATDKAGATAEKTVTAAVTDVNEAPVVTSGATATIAENAATSTVLYTATASDVDAGETRTFSLKAGGDAAMLNIDPATGAVTLKASADLETKSSYSFTVVVTDKGGLTAEKAVVANVTNVNEAPVVTSAATATIAENAATSTVLYTATATDVDAGDTRVYSLKATGDAAMLNIDAATGAVTLKASANFEAKASYTFTVVATDAGGLTAEKEVVATVTNVNEAPVITSSATAASIAENGTAGAVVYTATATDVDAGTTLTYSLSGADASAFSINSSTGVVTINNANNFEAKSSYSFNVVATDNGGLTATQAVTLATTNVNEAPVAVGDTATTPDNTAVVINVLANDSDVDAGDVLSINSVTQGANGSVVITGTSVTYTPNPTFLNGTDTFTYVTKDAAGLTSAPVTVTVTVNTVNSKPVIAASQAFSVNENDNTAGKSVGFVAASDQEGNGIGNWVIVGGNAAGNFTINNFTGEITRSATANFDAESTGSYTLQIQAQDTSGLKSDVQTVTVNVANLNDVAPVVVAASTFNVAENGTAVATVSATDGDSVATPITYTLGGADAAKFAISNAGVLTFVAAPNFEAPGSAGASNVYNLTVTANDGANNSTPKAITVTVTDVNDVAPVVTSGAAATFAENTTASTVVYTATATDADTTGEARTFVLGGADAALFNINPTTGAITFKTSPNFEAPADVGADNVYNVTVSATDGVNTSAAQAVAITVTNVNEVPLAVNDTATVLSGQTTNVTVLANDSDTDGAFTGTVTSVTQPAQGGLVEVAGDGKSVNFTSTPGYAGTSTFTYTITDAGGLTSTASVTMTVNTQLGGTNGNDNLIGSSANAETLEGGAGNDTIDGGGAADKLDGGADNDRVTARGGETAITGGSGVDTLVIASTFNTLQGVDLASGNQQAYSTATAPTTFTTATTTSVTSFENLDASAVSFNLIARDGAATTSISTGTGNDTITLANATGAVTVNAGAGTDTITSNITGTASIVAGDGNDTVTVTAGSTTVSGGNGNDTLTGGTGVDVINGDAGNDSITGGGGVDNLSGGDGDDTFVGLTSAETVSGGAGSDKLQFADAATTVVAADLAKINSIETIELLATTNTTSLTLADSVYTANGATTLTVTGAAVSTGVQTINASALTAANSLVLDLSGAGVNTAANVITFGAGNDTLKLDAGDTVSFAGGIAGGTGTDTVNFVGGGTLTLGAGLTAFEKATFATAANNYAITSNDANVAATSTFTVDGANLTGTLSWNGAAEADGKFSITGGSGNDTLIGGGLVDTIVGNAGNDSITGGAGVDDLSGGDGDDTFVGLTSAETVSGGAGSDKLQFADAATTVAAADLAKINSIETIELLATTNTTSLTLTDAVYTANGATTLTVTGAAVSTGVQTIDASALTAANTLTVDLSGAGTNSAANVLKFGAGNDTLKVDANDVLAAGAGSTGGTGTDTIQFVAGGTVTLPANLVAFEKATFATVTNSYNVTTDAATVATGATFTVDGANLTTGVLTWNGAAETDGKFSVTGGGAADVITGGDLADTIDGGAGNDTLSGGAGVDSIIGGLGNDSITGGAGVDNLSGGDGDDIFVGITAGGETVSGGAGADKLQFADAATTVAAADLSAINSIETIELLATTNTTSLTLTDAVYTANGSTTLTVTGAAVSTGVQTINASALTAVNSLIVDLSGAGVNTAANVITFGAGNDTLKLDAGDTFDLSGGIAGGTGTDTVNFVSGGTRTLTANLTAFEKATFATVTNSYNITTNDANVASGVTFTVDGANLTTGVLTWNGAAENDGKFSITGGAAADALTGGAGADTVDGGAGNDTIVGGAGDDNLTGGEGADSITGGTGADTINLSETTAVRDIVVVASTVAGNVFTATDSSRLTFDVISNFAADKDAVAGLNATADVIDFGAAILTAAGVTNGFVSGTLATAVSSQTTFLNALQLIENEFKTNQNNAQNGTIAFSYGGDVYVGRIAGADGAESFGAVVKLVGVTGVNALITGGVGTEFGVAAFI